MTKEEQEKFDRLNEVYGEWTGAQLFDYKDILDEDDYEDFEWWYEHRSTEEPELPEYILYGLHTFTREEIEEIRQQDKKASDFIEQKEKLWGMSHKEFEGLYVGKVNDYMKTLTEKESDDFVEKLEDMSSIEEVEYVYNRFIKPLEPKE